MMWPSLTQPFRTILFGSSNCIFPTNLLKVSHWLSQFLWTWSFFRNFFWGCVIITETCRRGHHPKMYYGTIKNQTLFCSFQDPIRLSWFKSHVHFSRDGIFLQKDVHIFRYTFGLYRGRIVGIFFFGICNYLLDICSFQEGNCKYLLKYTLRFVFLRNFPAHFLKGVSIQTNQRHPSNQPSSNRWLSENSASLSLATSFKRLAWKQCKLFFIIGTRKICYNHNPPWLERTWNNNSYIPGSPNDQTKWLVFRMIHVKDSLLPRAKLDFLGTLSRSRLQLRYCGYLAYLSHTSPLQTTTSTYQVLRGEPMASERYLFQQGESKGPTPRCHRPLKSGRFLRDSYWDVHGT